MVVSLPALGEGAADSARWSKLTSSFVRPRFSKLDGFFPARSPVKKLVALVAPLAM